MRPLEKIGELTNVPSAIVDEAAAITSGGTGRTFVMPKVGGDSIYAATAKEAGRLNATAVPPVEHRALLEERQKLLDLKFAGTISKREENRLAYVRWSLDRIEDARHGAALDALEEHVGRYESLLSEITKISSQVQAYTTVNRRR